MTTTRSEPGLIRTLETDATGRKAKSMRAASTGRLAGETSKKPTGKSGNRVVRAATIVAMSQHGRASIGRLGDDEAGAHGVTPATLRWARQSRITVIDSARERYGDRASFDPLVPSRLGTRLCAGSRDGSGTGGEQPVGHRAARGNNSHRRRSGHYQWRGH